MTPQDQTEADRTVSQPRSVWSIRSVEPPKQPCTHCGAPSYRAECDDCHAHPPSEMSNLEKRLAGEEPT